jgi:hypothetical protein
MEKDTIKPRPCTSEDVMMNPFPSALIFQESGSNALQYIPNNAVISTK